jgi:hypothetical protein
MHRPRHTVPVRAGGAVVGDPAQAVLGEVTGLVAVTIGCALCE